MYKKITFFLFILTFGINVGNTQDIHFTSYEFSPLTLNPALAGGFSGTYRVGGIYRDQWRSVAGAGAFRTINIHVDAPIIPGIRKQDWIGIGINVFSDRSGSFEGQSLVYNKSYQGISYHLSLDKKQTQIISFGLQNGTGSRKLDSRAELKTESFIRSADSADDLLFAGKGISAGGLVDWVGGVTFSSYQKNLSFIRGGFSVGRINRDNQSFIQKNDKQKLKFTAFGLYDFPVSGNLFITPSVLYQRTGNNQEMILQTKAGLLMSEKKETYVNFGIGWRVGDAIQIMAGYDMKNIKVQLAYDSNVSGLIGASRSVGAFELAVSYVGKVYKKPKIDPTEVCPRL